jgi:hypothetical protein
MTSTKNELAPPSPQDICGSSATDHGEYQYEIRSAVRRPQSGRNRKRFDALRLMASMSFLCAVRDVCNFGARHLVSKPHPGSRHAKPKDLVSIGFRSARHRHTLLNQMLVNSDFHLRRPLRRAGCRSMSSRVRQRFDPQMAECGQLTSTLIAFFRTLSSISLPFMSSTQAS